MSTVNPNFVTADDVWRDLFNTWEARDLVFPVLMAVERGDDHELLTRVHDRLCDAADVLSMIWDIKLLESNSEFDDEPQVEFDDEPQVEFDDEAEGVEGDVPF